MRLYSTMIALYIGVGIVTFGIAAERCQMCGNENMLRALIASESAIMWPLWWSWQITAWVKP